MHLWDVSFYCLLLMLLICIFQIIWHVPRHFVWRINSCMKHKPLLLLGVWGNHVGPLNIISIGFSSEIVGLSSYTASTTEYLVPALRTTLNPNFNCLSSHCPSFALKVKYARSKINQEALWSVLKVYKNLSRYGQSIENALTTASIRSRVIHLLRVL